MKRLHKIFYLFTFLTLLLSACGTAEDSAEENNGTDSNQVIEEQETDDNEQKPPEDDTSGEQNETEKDGTVRILEENIQYTVNEETKEETAFLKTSDNQKYTMFVLPEYELTAEEPNKDVLYFAEDDQIFMRIEVIPNDVDWASLEENTKAQLSVVNTDIKNIEVPEGEFFQNTKALESTSNNDIVRAYLVNNEELSLKLTLFLKENQDHSDPFLKMAETIELR